MLLVPQIISMGRFFWVPKTHVNSLPTGVICLITFTNNFDPDQAWKNVESDGDPNFLTRWWYSQKNF